MRAAIRYWQGCAPPCFGTPCVGISIFPAALTWWCPQLPEEHKLQYVAEFTSDGVNWQPGTVSRAFGEAGALVRCMAADPASPIAGERRFGRVRVTGLP